MRRAALLAALALAACSPRMHRAYRASVTAAALTAYTVDTRQTIYGLRSGAADHEANFLYGRHPSELRLYGGLALSHAMILGLNAGMERIDDRGPETEWVRDVVVTVPLVLGLAVVSWNASVIGWESWREW